MNWTRLAAALLVLASPSYAAAAGPEGSMGASMPDQAGFRPVTRSAPASGAQAGRAAIGSKARPARYAQILGALQPEGRTATRGAKESQVYMTASPAVVLVVAGDALGSGALISKDGEIVTNLHVVGDAKEVGVIFKPATEGDKVNTANVHVANVIRRDEVADLALIKVTEVPGHVAPLAIGGTDAVQVGSDVHAIGHPTGEAWTYTRGIVSQIRRDYEWAAEDRIPHKATIIQTQTPINPGNSGGPLIDDASEIIGINSFKGDGEGLNYAVSAEDVKAFLGRSTDRLIAPETRAKVNAEVEAAKAACESKAVAERRSDEYAETSYGMDIDCDDKADFVLVVPDSKKKPAVSMLDTNDDGEIDMMVFDDKQDGTPNYAMIDTDFDGKPDMTAYYRRGEFEPYRYEPMKEG